MTPNQIVYSVLKTIGILVGIVLLLWLFYEVRIIFVYILISFVVALVGRPFVNFFKKRLKIPYSMGAAITLVFFIALIIVFNYFFLVLLLREPVGFLQSYSSFDLLESDINKRIEELKGVLQEYHLGFVGDQLDGVTSGFDVEWMSNVFGNSLSFLGGLIMDVFSVCFISFFFLKDKDAFQNMVINVMPTKHESRVLRTMDKIKNLLSRYFIGLIVQVFIMFIFYLTILLIFGVEYAVVIALICGTMNLIPYVGPLIGGVIMVLFSLSYFISIDLDFQAQIIPKLLWILGLYIVAQLWDNFVNQPKIYSSSVRSSPLEIFIIIIAGGLIAGLVGVIVAVPAYTVIRVILKEFFSEYKIVQNITKGI